jgi:DNA polymerase
LEAVRPELIVCLGAVAAQSLLGSEFKVTKSHGEVQHVKGLPPIVATLHPSAILRARTEEDRERDTRTFIQDLAQISVLLR